jgi:hypothetical protein
MNNNKKWAVAICITSVFGHRSGFTVQPEVGLEFVEAETQDEAQKLVGDKYADKMGSLSSLYVFAREVEA